MESLSMDPLQSRKPSKSYAPFLKEKWLQFQIKTLAQHGSMPFHDYKKFIEFFNQASMEDKEKLAEFYIHNLSLT